MPIGPWRTAHPVAATPGSRRRDADDDPTQDQLLNILLDQARSRPGGSSSKPSVRKFSWIRWSQEARPGLISSISKAGSAISTPSTTELNATRSPGSSVTPRGGSSTTARNVYSSSSSSAVRISWNLG
jgi:hypothetical protein